MCQAFGDSYLHLSTDPGLGIELNCEVIEGLLAEEESYAEE
jgi:L-alanine-DL-glutamate epimerase-like enolase superfamily enzyme|tara:strand:+ start:371 stop:493 length:123 start_codon:yes stop_codon:yes gene_type:complete